MAKIVNLEDQQIYTFQEKAPYQANPIHYIINENGDHICKSHAYDKDGYPRVHRANKDWRMNRYVWEVANNREIPRGLKVRHTCDCRSCINPEHLILGTHQDNMNDMKVRGRSLKGSKHPQAKLNEHDVYFIKFKSSDIAKDALSKMFNITIDTINEIRRGRTWKHVTDNMKQIPHSTNVA